MVVLSVTLERKVVDYYYFVYYVAVGCHIGGQEQPSIEINFYLPGVFGWGWLAGWAGQPPHMDNIYMNQPAVLLSHINEPAMIRSSQPNRL